MSKIITAIFTLALSAFWTVWAGAQLTKSTPANSSLTQSQASHFAQLALKCITREYPNKPDHVLNDTPDVQSPKALRLSLERLR